MLILVTVVTARSLLNLRNRNNIDLHVLEAQALQEILGLGINVQLAALELADVEGGDLGDVLVLALTLLLLELEGDTADGATLDAAHQVGGVAGDL